MLTLAQAQFPAETAAQIPVVARKPFEFGVWIENNSEPLIVTVLVIVLAFYVVTLLSRRLTRQIVDEVGRHKARRTISYLAQFIALAVIGATWASKLNLQLWIGLASAGLTLALQNVILGFAGWIHITIRRPYDIGDRIQIGKVIGDVIDVRLFHTCVLEIGNWVDADQSTGRVAFIPNGAVFTQPVFNYTQGFPYIWNELPILVSFDSDWRLAKKMLEQLIVEETRDLIPKAESQIARAKLDYPILYEHLTPIVYTSLRETGVLLTVRYLTEVRQRRQTAAQLHERILDMFTRQPQVRLAFSGYPAPATAVAQATDLGAHAARLLGPQAEEPSDDQ
jgi:small-conductance mechanosensitive channel